MKPAIGKATAGFALPPALAMAGAAFDPPHLLGRVNNLPIYILVGALSVMWITWTVLFPANVKLKRRPSRGREAAAEPDSE